MQRLTVFLLAVGLAFTSCSKSGRSTPLHEAFLSLAMPPRLEAFRKDVGRYPTQEEGLTALISAPEAIKDRWRGPYAEAEKIPLDPWMHEYAYRCPNLEKGKSYDLICRGPTGKEDYYVFSK